ITTYDVVMTGRIGSVLGTLSPTQYGTNVPTILGWMRGRCESEKKREVLDKSPQLDSMKKPRNLEEASNPFPAWTRTFFAGTPGGTASRTSRHTLPWRLSFAS